MNTKTRNIIIFVVILVVIFLLLARFVVKSYDKAVAYDEEVIANWGNVESSYQRRSDLIPKLVNTVKGYAEYEQETLTQVIEARAKATQITIDPKNLDAEAIEKFQATQDGISSALSRLLAVVERYPDLKANQNYLELQAQLEGTENRINVARNDYNNSVRKFNTHIRGLLRRWAIKIAGGDFERKEPFKAQQGADVAPVVEF
ncbi:MAG TPA: LemA family protein [Bacteroidales bacterium]|nr:LemA family protein [Bacteroidales bacterium]